MKIEFAPCGIGLGHVGRCVPIAKKLQENNNHAEILFSTYTDGVGYARQAGFRVAQIPPIGFKVKLDGSVDFKQTVANPDLFFASFKLLRQVDADMRVMQRFKPDVVVSDTRVSPLAAARMLDIPRLCILNQFQVIIPRRTHFLRLARFADIIGLALIGKLWTTGLRVMIPDFPEPYTLSTGNLRMPKSYKKRVKFIGPIIEKQEKDLPSQKALRKKLRLDEGKSLIFAPISGPTKEKAYLTGILRQIFNDFPEDYQVVMSLGYPDASIKPARNGNVSIYRWLPNRFEYLKACDIVLSRAGHGTIAQSLCYGKPMILVPTPNHTEQNNNAKKVAQLGIAKILEQKSLSKQTLLKTAETMSKDERYLERAKKVKAEVADVDGLTTAAETIKEVAEGGW